MFSLKTLKINNFRCYKAQKFTFSEGLNAILGKNAVGKTSVVEAIHYLCFARSFRASKDSEIINKNAENFYLCANFTHKNDDLLDKIEVSYDGVKKVVSFNGNPIKKISDMVGYFKVVCFSPDDINTIKLEPARRRKYIDASLCQVDKEYLASLTKLKRIYKEKSVYLHNHSAESVDLNYIRTLNQEYVSASSYIIRRRKEFVCEIEELAKQIITRLGTNENISLEYLADVTEEDLKKTSEEKLGVDLLAKGTTWGPLRDDLAIYVNSTNAQSDASQGQTRTIAIALKLALVEYFKKESENIIVILDDVLSELDKDRQNALMSIIGKDNQVFITATDVSLLSDESIEGCQIINL